MHIFREFNEKHARDIFISLIVYQGVVTATFWAGYLLDIDTTNLVSVTVLVLLAAHLARVFQIYRFGPIDLKGSQIALITVALLAIILLAAYAYFSSSYVAVIGTSVFTNVVKVVFVPLFLAATFSPWIDFLLVYLIKGTTKPQNTR